MGYRRFAAAASLASEVSINTQTLQGKGYVAVPGPGCDLTRHDTSGGESNEGRLGLIKGDGSVLCSEGRVSSDQGMQNMGIISQEML